MKSYIFGGLTCVVVMVTVGSYSKFFSRLEDKAEASGTSYQLFAVKDQSEPIIKIPLIWTGKATSLTAVGWEGCPACKRFKETTLPALVKEGYEVHYTDKALWKGPRITMGPTLFFYDADGVIVKVYRGAMTAEQVKQWLKK